MRPLLAHSVLFWTGLVVGSVIYQMMLLKDEIEVLQTSICNYFATAISYETLKRKRSKPIAELNPEIFFWEVKISNVVTKAGVANEAEKTTRRMNHGEAICSNSIGIIHKQFEKR
jgi:hypothetical protein